VPFAIDYLFGLTYFSSLTFWLLPTLILLPRFLDYTDPNGRRRSAMLWSVCNIVVLGILLDCVFGRIILHFDDAPDAYIGWLNIGSLGIHIPLEEFIFYAMGPVAILLVYGWADEYWLTLYSPRAARSAIDARSSAVSLSTTSLGITGVLLIQGSLVYRHLHAGVGFFPPYFTFLVALALTPAALLFARVAQYVNWRAFGVTTLYLLITSLVWEATLAIPRHWWGYQPRAMLGIWVSAWTADLSWPFPIEAALVWLATPFSCVLLYEFVKFRQYRANPAKTTFVHPDIRASLQPPAVHVAQQES